MVAARFDNIISQSTIDWGRLKENHHVGLPGVPGTTLQTESFSFPQLVDHFDPHNKATFQQLFYVIERSTYKPGGPVFLYSIGEAALSTDYLRDTQIQQLAEATGGLFVALEHRFYGQSQPSKFTVEKLIKLHTLEQSLEDFAYFIRSASNSTGLPHLPSSTKWIVAGCSYSGALAAWMRTKYPDLVFAGLAGSAPVQLTIEFPQYQDEMRLAFDGASTAHKCGEKIVNLVSYIDSILDIGNSTSQVALFQLFGYPPNADPIGFANDITTAPAGLVQYDQVNSAGVTQVDQFCEPIGKAKSLQDQLKAYSQQVRKILGPQTGGQATLSRRSRPSRTKATSVAQDDGNSWTWQFCTQFGYFQVAANHSSVFSRRVNDAEYRMYCTSTFGSDIPMVQTSTINHLNSQFGHGAHNHQSRIIWVNGQYDPWSRLSIKKSLPPSVGSSVYVIGGAGHCSNVYLGGTNFKDVPGVQSKIQSDIVGWLAGNTTAVSGQEHTITSSSVLDNIRSWFARLW